LDDLRDPGNSGSADGKIRYGKKITAGEISPTIVRITLGCGPKTCIPSFPKYPHRPGKRYTLQLMLLAVISGHDIPIFNRNGGRIGGIAKQ